MPREDLIGQAEEFRAQLLRQEREAEVRLIKSYLALARRIQQDVEALTRELETMAALGQDITPWKVTRLQSLKRMQKTIVEEVDRYAVIVENEIDQGAQAAIKLAQKHARDLTQAALPGLAPIDAQIMATWMDLDSRAIESLLGFLGPESPLRKNLDTLGADVADVVTKHLLNGIGLGYNPRKVARLINNDLGLGLDWSLRTARTAQLWTYREASRAAYIANQDIVPEWEWRSARSATTCMACLAMDGTRHPVTEPLADHYNGKCSMVPVTVSYRDLGFDVDEPKRVIDDTGEQWFRAQPASTQKQMMGPEKWQAWNGGQFPFAKLAGKHTDATYGEMTVETPLKNLIDQSDATAAA